MQLKKRLLNTLLLIFGLFFYLQANAQKQDSASVFAMPVQMDSFVVHGNMDINAFIHRVETDTTFYKAFKSMRLVPYQAINDIDAYNKDGLVAASLHSKTRQEINKGCRATQILEQRTAGDFYKKNGDYNYYTASLYDYLFFAKTPVCGETDIIGSSMEDRGKGMMEKNKYELKQLLFNPDFAVE